MSRVFTTNDVITYDIGTLANLPVGAQSFGFIFKPTNSHRGGVFDAKQGGSGGSRQLGCNTFDNAGGTVFFSDNGSVSTSYSAFIGNWVLMMFTKPAGTAQVRGHIYDYNAVTWTHTDLGSVSVGAVVDFLRQGQFDGGQWLEATMLVMGAWVGTELSDANVETMEFSLNAWTALSPSALWPYPDNTDPIADITGNGADENARTGTTNSSDAPVGWSFDDLVSATFAITLPTLTSAFSAEAVVQATFSSTLPALTMAASAEVSAGATFNITLPALTVAIVAEVPLEATFNITLPTITAAIQATVVGSDLYVSALAAQLLACLCAEIQNQPNPPKHCCYRVGTEVAHDAGPWVDQCCEGIAYVSLGTTSPSSTFPDNDIARQASTNGCGPPSWAQVFQVGIIRCVPTGDDTGNPPTCEEWNEAGTQNIIDAFTLRQVECCMRDWIKNNEGLFLGMGVIMGAQTQGNPLGGCVERSFTITIQFPNDCDC